MDLLYALFAAFAISLLAFSGWVYKLVPEKKLQQVLPFVLAVAIGVLLGNSFFHLIPDAVNELGSLKETLWWVLVGLVVFFAMEKLLGHDQQGRAGKIKIKPVGKMILLGDAVHNFIDGCLIAASFATSTELGLITTIAIAFHELPQEISDTGVLIHSGYSLKKAVLLNFLVALTVLPGVVFFFFLKEQVSFSIGYMPPITAGGFIYIALANMLPGLQSSNAYKSHIGQGIAMLAGLTIMLLTISLEQFLQ